MNALDIILEQHEGTLLSVMKLEISQAKDLDKALIDWLDSPDNRRNIEGPFSNGSIALKQNGAMNALVIILADFDDEYE